MFNLDAQPPAPLPKPQRHRMWVKRDDKGAYTTIIADLYNADMPSFRNYISMTPEFFERLKEGFAPRLTKRRTNWREPLSVGLKIAVTLRLLATGETYTSLHYQFRAGKVTVSKFAVPVCRAIFD